MNSLLLGLGLNLAEADNCPNGDLFAHRLDAYSIQLPQETIRFRLIEENGEVVNPALIPWEQFLQECGAPLTLSASNQWVESWSNLIRLGVELNNTPIWRKYRVRKEVREQERLIALQYASLLRSLELETGISVRWNPDEHWLADGMISTARGSDKVFDYIEIIYAE